MKTQNTSSYFAHQIAVTYRQLKEVQTLRIIIKRKHQFSIIDATVWSGVLLMLENLLREELRDLQEKHAETFDRDQSDFHSVQQGTQALVASVESQQNESHHMDYLPADALRN